MGLNEENGFCALLLQNVEYLFRPVVATECAVMRPVIECQQNPNRCHCLTPSMCRRSIPPERQLVNLVE